MTRLVVLALVGLIACGKNKDSDSQVPTGATSGSWTTETGGSGTPNGLPGGKKGGSGGSGGSGVPTITSFVGDAAIDLDQVSWTGTESARVLNVTTGTLLCQWSWTALDWQHDPAVSTGTPPVVPPCVDSDGNACLFEFTVNLSSGFETDGLCSNYGFAVDEGAFHYGYAEDWSAGGTGYGPQFAYYLPGAGTPGLWFPVMQYGAATWTPGVGAPGQLHYEIRKTLLGSYVP